MSKLISLIGQKFSRLLVISRAENSKHGKTRWNCVCDCGNKTVVDGSNSRIIRNKRWTD